MLGSPLGTSQTLSLFRVSVFLSIYKPNKSLTDHLMRPGKWPAFTSGDSGEDIKALPPHFPPTQTPPQLSPWETQVPLSASSNRPGFYWPQIPITAVSLDDLRLGEILKYLLIIERDEQVFGIVLVLRIVCSI